MKTPNLNSRRFSSLALGLGVGVAIGVALNNFAVGIAIGVAVGVAFMSASREKKCGEAKGE